MTVTSLSSLPRASFFLCPSHPEEVASSDRPGSPCRVPGDRRMYSGCPRAVWESGDSSSSRSNTASSMVTRGRGRRPCPLPGIHPLPGLRICVPQTPQSCFFTPNYPFLVVCTSPGPHLPGALREMVLGGYIEDRRGGVRGRAARPGQGNEVVGSTLTFEVSSSRL